MRKSIIRVFALCFIFHVDQNLAIGQRAARPAEEKLEVGSAEAIKYSNTIKAGSLKEHLQVLASDEYEGRETGQRGQKKAAQYLADYYKSLGLQPIVNGSWFQQYPLKKESYLNSSADSKGKKYKFIEDFYFFGNEAGDLKAEQIVFAGYGIEDVKYSDYKGLDVNGKVVMCLMGEPTSKKGIHIITGNESTSSWSDDWEQKAELASRKGAKAILFVNMYYDQYLKRVRYWLEQAPMRLDRPEEPEVGYKRIPIIFISPEMANDILISAKSKVEDLNLKIDKKSKTKTKKVASDLVFHMEPQSEKLDAENVLCFIEGTDPVLKNEIVVISAHYDHIGIVNGNINNGADDDGSGTVTTLELAEAFVTAKNEGQGTKRSILILNVSGEEKGLLGSEWYSLFPVFPLENTVCDLNIDMIGRKDDAHPDPNYVYIIGSDKLSTDLHKISENCNKEYTNLALDYTYNNPDDPNRFYYRSDHYNFAKNNIPVIFYFSGVHEDYHKPGDDTEKILFDKMETIAKLVFHTAWVVANRDEKLKVDVINNFEQD